MNQLIKDYARASGVKLWQVAERLGMHDSSLSKKLRYPLTSAEEEQICNVIDNLAKHNEEVMENGMQR